MIEINLLTGLPPLEARTVDFGGDSVTLHPYFAKPEVRMLRLHSMSGAEFNFELFSFEWMIPYGGNTCAQDTRMLLRMRHSSVVSDINLNNLERLLRGVLKWAILEKLK